MAAYAFEAPVALELEHYPSITPGRDKVYLFTWDNGLDPFTVTRDGITPLPRIPIPSRFMGALQFLADVATPDGPRDWLISSGPIADDWAEFGCWDRLTGTLIDLVPLQYDCGASASVIVDINGDGQVDLSNITWEEPTPEGHDIPGVNANLSGPTGFTPTRFEPRAPTTFLGPEAFNYIVDDVTGDGRADLLVSFIDLPPTMVTPLGRLQSTRA
jgi:hypothetical protein